MDGDLLKVFDFTDHSSEDNWRLLVNDELQFHYPNSLLSCYSDSRGWFGRKLIALPLASIGIIKAIYHLSMVFFKGLYHEKRSTCMQMYTYAAVRDLEESFGRIVTLFSDKRGRYLVEESIYQKSCYFLTMGKIEGLSSEELQPFLYDLDESLLRKISGPQLQGLDLSCLSLGDLEKMFPMDDHLDFTEETKERFSYLSSAQVQSILHDLDGDDVLELISGPQLQGLDLSSLSQWDLKSMFPRGVDGEFTKETKTRFSSLSTLQIQPILEELRKAELFELIFHSQF